MTNPSFHKSRPAPPIVRPSGERRLSSSTASVTVDASAGLSYVNNSINTFTFSGVTTSGGNCGGSGGCVMSPTSRGVYPWRSANGISLFRVPLR